MGMDTLLYLKPSYQNFGICFKRCLNAWEPSLEFRELIKHNPAKILQFCSQRSANVFHLFVAYLKKAIFFVQIFLRPAFILYYLTLLRAHLSKLQEESRQNLNWCVISIWIIGTVSDLVSVPFVKEKSC